MSEDRIYSLPLDRVGDFVFDEQVVDVFPDMISRSVPGYGSILAMTGELGRRYATPDSNIYDLGCSLGAATRLLQPQIPSSCKIHAIDSSKAMVTRLRELLVPASASQTPQAEVCVAENDIRQVAMENASFVVLNFTLQFLSREDRAPLLRRVCDGMRPGGALVLSEKVHFEATESDHLMRELHHHFKRANGYSSLEISQKRTALEKTLLTETVSTHIERLRNVGFENVSTWFQCFNFVSILAVK